MTAQNDLTDLSRWIDAGNAHRDPEAQLWGRVAKIGEEHGEVIEAMIGLTGQNPRKGVTHGKNELIAELLDVAITALGAIEHVTEHRGDVMEMFKDKLAYVVQRAGHHGLVRQPRQARVCLTCGDEVAYCGERHPADPRGSES